MKFNYTFEKKQMLCTLWAVLASLLLPLGAWAEIEPKEPAYVDGYYLISNADELIWFSNQVKNVSTKINGKLTADIDLDGKKLYSNRQYRSQSLCWPFRWTAPSHQKYDP